MFKGISISKVGVGADPAGWGRGNRRHRLMELLQVVSLVLVLPHALICGAYCSSGSV